ncbi:MAG TPA: aminotransferase class I/II-fold pyridoxal phosphate-dependent enzyme [Candidatus Limisoma gallistercoris]|jgi:dTDP-4-amino-4,6-dideoxygalactose transaminase|nr:aminotransferase class I/II-fold pyridoxal phosphate-dependent enzyme [Candidatus Limisoma gallistercoris]
MKPRIFLSYVDMGGTEKQWVDEAFRSEWIVPLGPNVDEFEHRLEKYLGAPYVVALSAGTAAIHLGLVAAGVETGDEVICQSFTFAASANPIIYQGAKPIFVDSEPDSWNMSPELLEEAIIDRKRQTGRYPKAIIPVHLYGMPAKMDEIMAIADKYGIAVVEDAAEALGSEYKGNKCGLFGRFGCLSFNGNKIITTSGGGALICHSEEEAVRVKFYATQAREPRPYYYHEVIGFNYRLSNVCAGIGCGQMDVLAEHVERRKANHKFYTEAFAGIEGLTVQQNPGEEFDSNFWLSTVLIDPSTGKDPETARQLMADALIETRRLWRPMHMQPIYKDAPYYGGDCCESLFDRGLCLPSGSNLSEDDLQCVADVLISYMKK